ncbi:vacuolar protein sorting-associated protein 13C-like isoform X4 [Dinothrombium tinctorium]|uniref:Vacuolar protein sorting-associated protein 13C-like isoform X4 n=1 Tax=Dinothrombium tinctorium TaxID=1965070 RepID=A0A3S3PKK3_9ACAR|nr:vacuolar protein sorting-associated protein 13C-like isoform X4 [Dinothrombium tinctorium]
MVFESVFANLLNQYLGEFIDDLSANQLKLGAFKGNVELRNLAVKPGAFDKLQLPFRVIQGHVGELVMKIPWMSLYTSPVIIRLKDVLVTCVPNVESEYNTTYEEEQIQAEKQRQLKNIDEAIKKAALKSVEQQTSADEAPQGDDFVTKLVAQVIKNLQFSVENVHIRYEDTFTYPSVPFAVGLTLSKLIFQTPNAVQNTKYSPSKPENCVYKSISLQCFSAYWNCYTSDTQSELVSLNREDVRDDLLIHAIAQNDRRVSYLNYILEPNNFSASTIINRKPEVEKFTMPLFDIDMLLDQFCLCFNRQQFESFLLFLDSLNRMKIAQTFRKWRPKDQVHNHAREWWQFAITSVLETDIRRKNREWSWSFIKEHRQMMRDYMNLYKIKLRNKNFTKEVEKKIAEYEAKMDVFSIVMARNDAHTAINEEKKKEKELGNEEKQQQKGWFSWFWGEGKQSEEQKQEKIVDQFKSEMTAEEKLKLYKAIGYEETKAPTTFPPEFVAHLLNINFKSIKFMVIDIAKNDKILHFTLDNVNCELHHRPASDGILFKSNIKALGVQGCRGVKLTDEESSKGDLLSIKFELNPLDKRFDYGIDVNLKQIRFTFDALTINTLLDIVSPPQEVSLQEIQTIAAIKLDQWREMSVTGLEYAIQQHKQLSVNINTEPSFVIVPENGDIFACNHVLLLCLGRLNITSDLINKQELTDIREKIKNETNASDDVISQFRENAYEKYSMSISQIQAILTNSKRWKSDIDESSASLSSRHHLINPISIDMSLKRAIISDDPGIPNLKVNCHIPSLYVKASDTQLCQLITLATSIPTNVPKTEKVEESKFESASVTQAKQLNDALRAVEKNKDKDVVDNITDVQLTELMLNFVIGQFVVDLKTANYKDVLKLIVRDMGSKITKKTFQVDAEFYLKELRAEAFNEEYTFNNPYLLLQTSLSENLLHISYHFIAQNSPVFENVVQKVEVKMSQVTFSVSSEILKSILIWSQEVVNSLPKSEQPLPPPETTNLKRRSSSLSSLATVGLKPKRVKMKKSNVELDDDSINNFVAHLDIESIILNIDAICAVEFSGFACHLVLFASERITFNANWKSFEVMNKVVIPDKTTAYNYIIQSEAEKVLELGVVMYPKKEVESVRNQVDILVKVSFGRLKIVFLNKFVTDLLSFLTVFEAAKEKALTATSAAADYAKQSAMNAYESATKLGLNVVLEAPIIVIPRNWDSKQYVLLNLGKVVVTNQIQTMKKLILDKISCELSSTRISVIGDTTETSLDDILSPISFTIQVTRNLSFEVNKREPELSISASLNDLKLDIAQSDIQLLMQILAENLGSDSSSPPQPVSNVNPTRSQITPATQSPRALPSPEKETISQSITHSSVIVEEAVVHVDAENEGALREQVFIRMNFDFKLPRITLTLYEGNSKTSEHAKICLLKLKNFECRGIIRTDDTIHADLEMTNIVISDVRKSRKETGIRKLLYAKISKISNEENDEDKKDKMLRISYTQQNDTFIDINMSGFACILALDYILRVTNIITSAMQTPEAPPPAVTNTNSMTVLRSTPVTSNEETLANPSENKSTTLMVVDFKMSKMDVILLESIDTADCSSLILNSIVEVGVKLHEQRINFNGNIHDIQLAITNFSRYQKNDNDIDAFILKPTELNIHAAIDGPNSQHFDVTFGELKFQISPNTIQVVLSILSALGSSQTEESKAVTTTEDVVDVKTFFNPKEISDQSKYWYLKSEISPAVEVTEETNLSPPTTPVSSSSPFLVMQQVVLTVSQISVVVESGGIYSQPMIKFESSITGRFDNWNKLDLTITSYMDYYNEKLFVWEPMIEPLENNSLWSCNLRVDIVENQDSTVQYNAAFESKDRLELTLSKSALDTLLTASDAFANAVKESEKLATDDYVQIINDLGIDLFVFAPISKFKCETTDLPLSHENGIESVRIISGKSALFKANSAEKSTFDSDSDINYRIILDDNQIERSLSMRVKEKRCYNIPAVSYPGTEWKYVVDMTQRDANMKKILFHSNVEIFNKFHISLELYVVENENIQFVSEIKSEEKLYLPLKLVYSPSQRIFVKPNDDYCTPLEYLSWSNKSAPKDPYFNVKCESKKGLPNFYIRVKQIIEPVLFEDSQEWIPDSILHKYDLLPVFKLRNLLPINIKYSMENVSKEWTLVPGQENDIHHFDLKNVFLQIKIENYLNKNWHILKNLPSKWKAEDQVEVWTYSAVNENRPSTMDLAINYSTTDESGIRVASIFSPFWMINKTNLPVSYKVGDNVIYHEKNLDIPVLVCFKPKTLFSKKKLALAIADTKWSDSFSIDAVGNKGTVVAKSKGKSKMSYCASIDIALSSFSLTKIVTVSPFYSVQNKTALDLQVSEDNDEWVTVNAKSTKELWPKATRDSKLYFKLLNEAVSSHPVSLDEINTVLLQIGNHLINIHVEVSVSSVSVQITNYFRGSAPVKIVNATNDLIIDYGQHCIAKRNRLAPMSSVYFTWHEPMLRRALVWSSSQSPEVILELDKDAFGETSSGGLYWVTFLDAKQRILMITRDIDMAKNALHAGEFAKPVYNLEVSMRGIGISLVNNETSKELLYIGIYSSSVVWEVAKHKSKRFKSLSVKQIESIEAAYQKELLKHKVNNDLVIKGGSERQKPINITNTLKVDFTDLKKPIMIEPIKGVLRRSSTLGFWCCVGLSEHVVQFHTKINRIQIDNQADDCTFGIIMCPVTPPKSLSQDRAPKAFIELSVLIQRQANMNRFKYLSVLIQEFLVQVDGDFLMALSDFFGGQQRLKETSYEKMIENDLKSVFDADHNAASSEIAMSNKNYYDLIHFSPIKVHVSFALGNVASFEILGFLDFLIKSAGVTLTEFKDVLFKIDYFEKKNILLSQEELISNATSHYITSVLKQFYLIVLGLDVIGNPVGLLLGLKQGVGDFFYEPVVGIIEGPEEFAEGLTLGFKSLFSHTVGGAAGALGRITGTIGQGISSLTMDEEDKRRRRETLNRGHSFAQSGKNLAKGFFSGVTGIVTKPLQGGKTQGFEGFVKGVGRGVVGVVAQPATGVIDFASGSLNALQRAVDVNAEAKKQRPARHIHKDGIIRPYNRHEANGRSILRELNKGHFADTDVYIAHYSLGDGILLLSDRNVFFLKHACVFKNLEIEWYESYENILNMEIVNDINVKLSLKEQRKKLVGLMSGELERVISCQSPDTASDA